MAIVYLEHGLLNVIRMNSDLVITLAEVQLGEIACTGDLVQKLLHCRDGRLIFNCDDV